LNTLLLVAVVVPVVPVVVMLEPEVAVLVV
jgi:hypothetical protein